MLTQQLPVVGLENITTFFELSQLGVDMDSDSLFIHGAMVRYSDMLCACSNAASCVGGAKLFLVTHITNLSWGKL